MKSESRSAFRFVLAYYGYSVTSTLYIMGEDHIRVNFNPKGSVSMVTRYSGRSRCCCLVFRLQGESDVLTNLCVV